MSDGKKQKQEKVVMSATDLRALIAEETQKVAAQAVAEYKRQNIQALSLEEKVQVMIEDNATPQDVIKAVRDGSNSSLITELGAVFPEMASMAASGEPELPVFGRVEWGSELRGSAKRGTQREVRVANTTLPVRVVVDELPARDGMDALQQVHVEAQVGPADRFGGWSRILSFRAHSGVRSGWIGFYGNSRPTG